MMTGLSNFLSSDPRNARRCYLGLLCVSLATFSGCGTLANLEGKEYALISPRYAQKPQYYGGVRNDLRWMNPESKEQFDLTEDWDKATALTAFWLPDLPLSAAADTVSLPAVFVLRGLYDLIATETQWSPEQFNVTESSF